MNILIIGSGGREHAFAWKIAQSPLCHKLYIAPGNAGTSQYGENISVAVNDFEALGKLAVKLQIAMIVVGPEEPLVKGIYDYFRDDETLKHIAVIGPSAQGALLEGSKSFAKQFMVRYQIPTAAYATFTAQTIDEGFAFIEKQTLPIVLKADGLAAGKGVLICQEREEAKRELRAMMEQSKFGEAGQRVVIEQFLSGIEFSIFVLTDGEHYQILPSAKDYKRVGEGDTGLNTGGMGCISPVPFVSDAVLHQVEQQIIRPTVEGLKKEGIVYRGFLYLGLMKVQEKIYVIEYNCRMGDPETEIVFPRIKSDLLAHLAALHAGKLHQEIIETDERAAATVIVASGGYPEHYEKGKEITGLEEVARNHKNTIVFHAGTKMGSNHPLTNGGRVLAVSSFGKDIHEAVAQSNAAIEQIHFDGKYYRRDIGFEFR